MGRGGRGGGLVVSSLALFSVDSSLNLALAFFLYNVAFKRKAILLPGYT